MWINHLLKNKKNKGGNYMEGLFLATSDSDFSGLNALLMAIFGGYALLIIVVLAAILIPVIIVEYLIPAIALYKMAKRADYKYPWMAWVPIAQTYLEYILPKREFNVGFKTKERGTIALITIGGTYLGGVVVGALNTIPMLGQMLDIVFPLVLQVFRWRKMYDVIRTYKEKDISLAISIIGVFIPIVYSCALLSCINQEPEYGWGGYYRSDYESVNIDQNIQEKNV